MNARQKAKKYKKMVERYKDKAEAWDTYMRYSRYNYGIHPRRYGTIETLKVVKWWDDRASVDDELFKREMAMDLAEALLREGYIDFKVDDKINEYTKARRMTGTLKITKGGWDIDSY